jgi:hypothetical protein
MEQIKYLHNVCIFWLIFIRIYCHLPLDGATAHKHVGLRIDCIACECYVSVDWFNRRKYLTYRVFQEE